METSLVVTPAIAVAMALLVQAVKQAVPDQFHRFIPLALLFLGPAVGVGLALVLGNTWQQGVVEGIIAAAGAVFGFEFVSNLRAG